MRTLIVPLVCLAQPAFAALNDTGETRCYDGTSMVQCSADNSGPGSAYPGQDGGYGRDPAYAAGQFSKVGGGAAGFDFTKICRSGNPAGTGSCAADPTTDDADPWACTKDNHTQLVWSIDSSNATWSDANSTLPADYDAAVRCGFGGGWRLPTRRELLSIVNYGAMDGPAIDSRYFPATSGRPYWSSDVYSSFQFVAWYVAFDVGYSTINDKTQQYFVRLVHN